MSRLSISASRSDPGKNLVVMVGVVTMVIAVLAIFAPRDWWQTRDQQAQHLYDRGEYAAAAKLFTSPQRQGTALFRTGEFNAAADAFARVSSAQGHFNRGNALVMTGKYADAVMAYERALQLNPDWPEATHNLEIARLRAERTRREGGDMTGGMLGADEIVFSTEKSDTQGGGDEQTDGGQTMSDLELQSLWLRRVQTNPADFLRAKFAFQLAVQESDQETP